MFCSLLTKLKYLLLSRLFSFETKPSLNHISSHVVELLLLLQIFALSCFNFPLSLPDQVLNHLALALDKTLRVCRFVHSWFQFQFFDQLLGFCFHELNAVFFFLLSHDRFLDIRFAQLQCWDFLVAWFQIIFFIIV